MKTRSIILLFAFIVMLPAVSNAQGYILRRAINRQIDNKIDSAIDKSAKDKAKQKEQSDQQQPDKSPAPDNSGTKGTGRGLFGGKIDIKYNDEYKFTGSIYMQMESYNNKEVLKL